MHELNWNILLEYIRAKDPRLAASFRGVPRRDIEACEAKYRVTFPISYVGFLVVMGEDSGSLQPFGRTQQHTFSEILQQLPLDDDPGERFFMIAFDVDPLPLADLKTFLDLARSDGNDAPLAVFETGEGASPIINDWDFMLGESLTRRIFNNLELDRRTYKGRVFVQSQNPKHGLEIKRASMELLAGAGFQVALPELNRVACLRRDASSAFVIVQDETHLVDVTLGTDNDLEGVDMALTSLLNAFPESQLIESARKRV